MYDTEGAEIPEFHGYVPNWSITSSHDVNITGREGHVVALEISESTTSTHFDVIAEAGFDERVPSPTARGQIHQGSPTVDHVESAAQAEEHPLPVVLYQGATRGPIAFSGRADLENLSGTLPIVILSASQAAAFGNAPWNAAPSEKVLFRGGPAGSSLLQLPPASILEQDLTFWIDPSVEDQWPATTVEAIAKLHVADANRIYERNRVGVRFRLAAINVIEDPWMGNVECGANPAITGHPLGGGLPVNFNDNNNANEIHVFVINLENDNGMSCREDDSAAVGYRIFLNGIQTLPDVLAHELGHVLLKMNIRTDHDEGAAIGASNLMVEGDSSQISRHYNLSLGQACDMNRSTIIKNMRLNALMADVRWCPPIGTVVP